MFQVAASGKSVQTASGPSSLLNDTQPMTKLDTTNLVSFQTISILFNHEPPQPDPVSFISDTLLYQFAHGYDYIPALWMAWQNPSPSYPANPTTVGASTTTFNAFGDDSVSGDGTLIGTATGLSLFSYVEYYDASYGVVRITKAIIYCYADTSNVYIYIRKIANEANSSGSIVPIYVIGESVNLRVYVFSEPATTSTY